MKINSMLLIKRTCRFCERTYEITRKKLQGKKAVFCSADCSKKQGDLWKKAYEEAAIKLNNTSDKEAIKLEAKVIMLAPGTVFTRRDVEKALMQNLIYEWDNEIFEQSLNCHSLDQAVKYVIDRK